METERYKKKFRNGTDVEKRVRHLLFCSVRGHKDVVRNVVINGYS
jgi:hypothetical protein